MEKRRFILITVEPVMGSVIRRTEGFLAGFPVEQDGEKMLISLFKENNYYSLSTRAYLITKVHYCVNGKEAVVFYNHGSDVEESKKQMKKSLNFATGIFKKFVAAAGVDLNRGVLPEVGVHTGYTQLKDVMKRVADTPADNKTNDKEGTPLNPKVVDKESEEGKEKEVSTTPARPTVNWKEPLWFSRKANQHTAKAAALLKEELINQIAEKAAKAATGVAEEEVGKKEDTVYAYRPGSTRTIPNNSLCMACDTKWQCNLPIEFEECHLFSMRNRMSMSTYPDGL